MDHGIFLYTMTERFHETGRPMSRVQTLREQFNNLGLQGDDIQCASRIWLLLARIGEPLALTFMHLAKISIPFVSLGIENSDKNIPLNLNRAERCLRRLGPACDTETGRKGQCGM